MGPILIFDKSALQALRLREAVLLNTLFLTNLTPLFYVETLSRGCAQTVAAPAGAILVAFFAR